MTETISALIVDDNEGIRFFLTETLSIVGYDVSAADSGEAALAQLREKSFDLILLDLNLGGRVDGLCVLRAAKWRWPNTAVIILTAYGTLESALAAIREGVDGYLLKPVESEDVRQAVQEALSRRKSALPETTLEKNVRVLHHGLLSLDLDKHMATLNEEPLSLTNSEFRLLAYLFDNLHRVVSARELVQAVRDYTCEDEGEARNIIKWYIHQLRKKIETDPSNSEYIVTIRGTGYTLGKSN